MTILMAYWLFWYKQTRRVNLKHVDEPKHNIFWWKVDVSTLWGTIQYKAQVTQDPIKLLKN